MYINALKGWGIFFNLSNLNQKLYQNFLTKFYYYNFGEKCLTIQFSFFQKLFYETFCVNLTLQKQNVLEFQRLKSLNFKDLLTTWKKKFTSETLIGVDCRPLTCSTRLSSKHWPFDVSTNAPYNRTMSSYCSGVQKAC